MKAVILLPQDAQESGDARGLLFKKVCGVPLLVRAIVTASRAGAEEAVLAAPPVLTEDGLRERLDHRLLSQVNFRIVRGDWKNPGERDRLLQELGGRFLLLPWDCVIPERLLKGLAERCSRAEAGAVPEQGAGHAGPRRRREDRPAGELTRPAAVAVAREAPPGRSAGPASPRAIPLAEAQPDEFVRLDSRKSLRRAETLLLRYSGKPQEGVYVTFNRWLCRPLVRLLAKMPVSANAITVWGLPLAILAAYLYAQGRWASYAAAGLAFFAAVLVDEMDGMIARVKFQESPFGCWLETAVDYTGFPLLGMGMAAGLQRQYEDPVWLWLGILTIAVNLVVIVLLVFQRKATTPRSQPHKYRDRYYGKLESDRGSWTSRAIRKIVFLARKGVMGHYILLFSALNLLPVLFFFVVSGSIIAFFVTLYMNQLFSAPLAAPNHERSRS